MCVFLNFNALRLQYEAAYYQLLYHERTFILIPCKNNTFYEVYIKKIYRQSFTSLYAL